ncbi:tRNA synthetases class I-domain-containing protein [Crepidotus variabilis]|uniref:Isoleucine--tRNA ligase, mitochondrial n=1 Tax=Crepidotus variabilis TaxID=179855 RepID=A0A9P6JJQ9_9AGAR|nr:tRNA synthetases class I-domain-containing protein [Crepidotus variabilis]
MSTRVSASWNVFYSRTRCRVPCLTRQHASEATNASVSPGAGDNKAFSKTLLLPKTSFKLRPDVKGVEEKYRKLSCDELYQWQSKYAEGPLFVLHDGPPYANGDLHMGHALNKVIKDIINRFHVSQGRKVHYVPGWDCHGLPIENKAMKDLKQDPLETPPEVVRDTAKSTALREITSQKEQFRTLGIMADWDCKERTYRTLDRHYEIRQLRIFQQMVENGLIYRQHRPVHYSPSSRSALAEAELEYKEDHVSHSVYVTFDVDGKCTSLPLALQDIISNGATVKLLVWTTTPWTLTANMGIAVHNDLTYDLVKVSTGGSEVVYVVASERREALQQYLGFEEAVIIASVTGQQLSDISYKPIFDSYKKSLKVITSSHVTSLSGTGLVHCAPAHGQEDYLAFKALDLISPSTTASNTVVCHVDSKGQFSEDVTSVIGEELAKELVGKEVLTDGNKAIVQLLNASGKIMKIQRIKHKYPYDWRTKKPIIVTATSQWFANLDKIKDDALSALQEVSFFPTLSRNRLEAFVSSRSEWCISRQRVWGVPIPALHHKHSDRVVLDSKSLQFIINAIEKKNLDWWTSPIEEFVPPWLLEDGKAASETWEKGRDTMDVWFDSGTSWSMLSEMGVGRNPDVGRKFDADLCLEGSDQHRGWFQSQLLTAIASAKPTEKLSSPYGSLLTHGMVLDEKGRKMSKSLGNIVSPMTLIQSGPDMLRLWAATVEYWRDMSIGKTVISQVTESLRKLRNTARFCLGNMGDLETLEIMERVPKSEMGLAERYIMNELYTLEQTALEGYTTYNFPKVINALNNFANITMSSLYFDITKDSLYANGSQNHERRAIVTVLEQVLDTMTRTMAPVLPYLAEEIHAARRCNSESVFRKVWTPLSKDWKDPDASKDMASLLRIRGTVLALLEKAREAKQLKSSLEAEVDIIVPNGFEGPVVELLHREEHFLKTLFIVSDASIADEGSLGTSSSNWVYSESISIPGSDDDIAIRVRPAACHKCPRCWTFSRLPDDRLCNRCEKVVETDHPHL